MSKPNSSEERQEHLLALAWSLWAELGVSGWHRSHSGCLIDVEPLIIFTVALGDMDPRLRDESTDWCISYGRYVALQRMKNLLAEEPAGLQRAFEEYAATVVAHSPLRWPSAGDPRPYKPSRRSRIEDFQRPSLLSLRLRALFGVDARAEIIRIFVSGAPRPLTSTEIASEAGFTKRNVANALEALRMAGLVEVSPWRNQLRYRLARRSELEQFLGELPKRFPPWRQLLRVAERLHSSAARIEKMREPARMVEVSRLLVDLEPDLRSAGLRPPPSGSSDERWGLFESWAKELLADLAGGKWEMLSIGF